MRFQREVIAALLEIAATLQRTDYRCRGESKVCRHAGACALDDVQRRAPLLQRVVHQVRKRKAGVLYVPQPICRTAISASDAADQNTGLIKRSR